MAAAPQQVAMLKMRALNDRFFFKTLQQLAGSDMFSLPLFRLPLGVEPAKSFSTLSGF